MQLHLVDNAGQPLEPRVVDAVYRLVPKIKKEFGDACDVSELSNCVEEAARSAAQDEKEIGGAENITAFVWARISNAIRSVIRSEKRLSFADKAELESQAGEGRQHGQDAILAGIEGRQLLSGMAERDRKICILEYLGYRPDEIAKKLGIKAATVWKAQSRRRAFLK